MNSPTITRRAAIIGAVASTAGLAAPVAAAVAAQTAPHTWSALIEHPNDKVRRLGKEMAAALRDPDYIGFARVTVTPQGVSYVNTDEQHLLEAAEADDLIQYHATQLAAALCDKRPGLWSFSTAMIESAGAVFFSYADHPTFSGFRQDYIDHTRRTPRA